MVFFPPTIYLPGMPRAFRQGFLHCHLLGVHWDSAVGRLDSAVSLVIAR